MTERVLFHVGLEKAGSTSIQEGLATLEPRLAAYGIRLSAAGRRRPDMARNILPWRNPEGEPWDVLRQELRRPENGMHTLLVSSQALWRQRDGILRKLNRFVEGTRAQVVMYVRDQAELVQSMAMQSNRTERHAFDFDDSEAFEEFASRRTPDYLDICRRFETIMGAEVEVRLFDPATFHQGQLLADVLSLLLPDVELAAPPDPHANPGLAADIARHLHSAPVTAIDAPTEEILDVALRFSQRAEYDKYFLDETAVRRIRDAHRDANEQCLARYLRDAHSLVESPAWRTAGGDDPVTAEELADQLATELAWAPSLAAGWSARRESGAGFFAEGWQLVEVDGITVGRMVEPWSSIRFRSHFQTERSRNSPLSLAVSLNTIDPAPARVSVNGHALPTVDLLTDTIALPDAHGADGRWEITLETPPGPRNIEVTGLELRYGAPEPALV